MIVFIQCVGAKKQYSCKAQNMYISPYFRKSLKYAKQLKPDKILILSAKYGVLTLNQIIKPYNNTLLKMSKHKQKVWSLMCIKQLMQMNIDFNEKAIFLTGKTYHRYISPYFKNKEMPFQNIGKTGLGPILNYLDEMII